MINFFRDKWRSWMRNARTPVVIVGYTPLTDDLIRMLLSENEKNSFDRWHPYGTRWRKKRGKSCSIPLVM